MSATVTTIVAPYFAGPNCKKAIYSVLLDDSYPTGGEAIDLTADFDYVFGVAILGNDTAADNGYVIAADLPGSTTALSASNLLLTAFWVDTTTDGAPLAEVTATTNLSAIGALMIEVSGK